MIQKTYAQINREIQALQAHAEKLRAAELQTIVTKLNETIAKYGLKAEDLRFAAAGSTSGAPVRASRQAASSASRPAFASSGAKYGDMQGNSWGGRGPRPAWLRDALSKGRSLESFTLSDTEASNLTSATQQRSSGKGKAAEQSAAAKSPLPPLYSHHKTGQTWSGRGPKPAWLKQGLKKRGASLNDFLISARESGGGVTDTAAPAASASPASSQSSRTAKAAAAAPQSTVSKKKSLVEKISSHTKASSAATVKPETASAPAVSTAPVAAGKKAAGKKAAAKQSSKATAEPAPAKAVTTKVGTSKAPKPVKATVAATPVAPAKKAASKSTAKAAAKGPKKPSAKKTGPANKRIASSMAPPLDTSSVSLDATAAPSPAQESGPADGPSPIPGV